MSSVPELPSHAGKRGKIAEREGELEFTIVDEVSRLQTQYASGDTSGGQQPRKYLVLQQVRFDNGITEIRSGYYLLTQRAGGSSYWTWARYSQLAPANDFANMIDEARRRGWFNGSK